MIFIFLVFLSISDIPQYSIIFISSQRKSQFERFVEELNDDKGKFCEKIYSYSSDQHYCKVLYGPLQSVKFSSGSHINDNIKKASKYSEYLFIILDEAYETINLNKLKNQNVVFISYDTDMYYKYHINEFGYHNLYNISYDMIKMIQKITNKVTDEKARSFTKICDKLIGTDKTKKSKASDSMLSVSIEGNIKNKVSFLSVSNIILNIVNDDLNIHSLYFYNSKIASSSKTVKSTFFIADSSCSLGSSFSKISVEQFGFQMYDKKESWHQIFFFNNQWCVTSKNDNLEPGYCYLVPYSCATIFNWIVRGNQLYITPEHLDFSPTTVNITIIDEMPRSSLLYYNDIEIIPYGNWSYSISRPKIIVTYDSSKYRLRYQSNAQYMFSVTEEKPYSYVPINRTSTDPNLIGIICGIVFIVVLTIIFIIIAVVYRPKKYLSEEEKLTKEV